MRVVLSDRIAHMNGDTVSYLLQRDLPGFRRLVGVSLVQCVASAVLAPGLLYLARSIANDWRQRLHAHIARHLFRNKAYYTVRCVSSTVSFSLN
jgi:hypothetical protein